MLIAVGMYLHFDTTAAIFVGGVLAWIVMRIRERRRMSEARAAASENRGVLIASGLIAGEALMAVALAALFFVLPPDPPGGISSVASAWLGLETGGVLETWGGWLSLIVFLVVAWMLLRIPLVDFERDRQEIVGEGKGPE
jgi:hypothetical protein